MWDFTGTEPLSAFVDVFIVELDAIKEDSTFGTSMARTARLRKVGHESLNLGIGRDVGTIMGRFEGEIGLTKLGEFNEALYSLVREDLKKIVLDLHMASLSSTAVGELVRFAASMHGREKRLYLFDVSPQIRTLLTELELLPFFSFLETEDDVLVRLVI